MTKLSASINLQGCQADSSTMQVAAEIIKRREEIEAKEVKQHKKDFINYCTEVLTQSKNDRGNDLPDKKEKNRVL